MIAYLIASTLCLVSLWVVYKLLLEPADCHRFKRFYLLFSLAAGFLAPYLQLRLPAGSPIAHTLPANQIPAPTDLGKFVQQQTRAVVLPATDTMAIDWSMIVWTLYGLVTALLLFRFGFNLYRLFRSTRRHPAVAIPGATLILMPDLPLPYTFLHYIFISQEGYRGKQIEQELLTHELAHVRQRHTFDRLLIELLICFCWFNPVLYLLRRAIELNHEFLADERVNHTYQNIPQYQHLLLSKLTAQAPLALASHFIFQTTKQRFIMMRTHTGSLKKAALVGTSLLAFAGTLILGSNITIAQTPKAAQKSPPKVVTATSPAPATKPQEVFQLSELNLQNGRYYSARRLPKAGPLKYSQLTQEEKEYIKVTSPQPYELRKTPTPEQFEDWKNPKKFGIWLDGKHIKNSELNRYKPEDIVAFSGSYVHKNARQPQGYIYQFDIMTEAAYQKYLKDWKDGPFVIIKKD